MSSENDKWKNFNKKKRKKKSPWEPRRRQHFTPHTLGKGASGRLCKLAFLKLGGSSDVGKSTCLRRCANTRTHTGPRAQEPSLKYWPTRQHGWLPQTHSAKAAKGKEVSILWLSLDADKKSPIIEPCCSEPGRRPLGVGQLLQEARTDAELLVTPVCLTREPIPWCDQLVRLTQWETQDLGIFCKSAVV